MKFYKLFSIRNEGFSKVIYILGFKIKKAYHNIFKDEFMKLPLENNKIVFINFGGKGYGCNPRYITDEIIKRKLQYKIVWLIDEENRISGSVPSEIEVLPFKSLEGLKAMATAKIWVSNTRLITFLKKGLIKREGQIYINTWHGSLGIKKIDADANPNFWKKSKWNGFEKKDSEFLDILISNSNFEDNVYKSAFCNKGKIYQLGHARNDIFFNDNTSIVKKVKNFYKIDDETNILLYVPSYRDDYRLNCYELDYKATKKVLEEKFGGKWVIMARLHPNIAKRQSILPKKKYVINATSYPDIQELLVSADAAITDYSSCIFDFMLSKKPGFIFATDIEKYNTDRGFYYPLESTPFPVATNNDNLCKNINNFDMDKYKEEVDKFLLDKGCMDDGHASERIVDLINDIMKGERYND